MKGGYYSDRGPVPIDGELLFDLYVMADMSTVKGEHEFSELPQWKRDGWNKVAEKLRAGMGWSWSHLYLK